ncbi:MAG: signal peptidase I [Chloroflexota bacterium]|nr:signal peptidase I [Chloroflexota bacterium]
MTYAPDDVTRAGVPVESAEPKPRRRSLGCAFEIVETLVLTLVIYLLIHNFIAQPFEVEQNSMIPTINSREYVLIDKITPRFGDFQRGDIVVFNPPAGYEQGGVPFIKRVIGVAGDTVRLENGRVFVTPPGGSPVQLGESYVIRGADGRVAPTLPRDPAGTVQWSVPPGSYFVMGDNRPVSQDSRYFGPISRQLIIGRAWLRYFPIDRIGFLNRPAYAGLDSGSRTTGWLRPGSSATIQVSIALR